MKIEIGTDFTEVAIKHKGIFKSKLVSLSDLLDELSIYRTTNFGLLPRSIRIIESSGNHVVIGLEFEPKKRDLRYRNSAGELVQSCNVPGGMMFIKLNRAPGGVFKVVDAYIYAIRGTRVTFPNDRLYNMPFPNIYGDGKICWGSVNIGDITALSAVEGMISSFFTNNFNSDLFGYANFSSAYDGPRGNFVSFFKHISENEFSDDWLEPTQYSVDQVAAWLLKDR